MVRVRVSHDEDDTLTLFEGARFLKVCDKTLRDECKAGRVPHQRVGTQFRFSAQALREWLRAKLVLGEVRNPEFD